MPTYILLTNLTDQGIRTAKEAINRVNAAKQMAGALGVRITTVYWTMGQYDGVMIVEAPDDETVRRFALAGGMQGNVRSTTMRAFNEEEMGRILQGMP